MLLKRPHFVHHSRAIALSAAVGLTIAMSIASDRIVSAEDSKPLNRVEQHEATAFARAAVRNDGVAELSVDEFRALEIGDTVVFPIADGIEVGMTLVEKRWLSSGPSAPPIYEWQ